MRTRLTPIALLSFAFLVPALARAADDEKSYDVKLERPYKVGDKSKVEALGAYHNKLLVRAEGQDAKTVEEAAGIRLDGVSEVKSVSKVGRRLKVSFTVTNCTLMVGEQSKEILPAGKVIECSWDGDKDTTKYVVEGKDITEELGELFDLALELSDPDGATDDEIFHTDGKKKVKDTWSIDPAITKKEFDRIGLKAKEDDLWGETTLQDVTTVEGKPALKLKSDFKVKTLAGPGRHADSKFKLQSGTLSVQSTTTLPTDESMQATAETAKITSTGELTGKDDDGKTVKVARVTERVIERTTTPAK